MSSRAGTNPATAAPAVRRGSRVAASVDAVVDRDSGRDAGAGRSAIDAVGVAVIGADRDGRIVLVNACAEVLFGYRADELLGRPVEVLVPRDLRERHVAQRTAFAAEPGGRLVAAGRVLSGQRKNGTFFPVEIVLGSVDSPDGPVNYATFIDVSAREAALAKQIVRRSALADLGQLGLSAPGQTLLDEAVAMVAANLDVELVTISELSRDGSALHVQAATGDTPAGNVATGPGTAAGFVLSRPGPVTARELAEQGLLDSSLLPTLGLGGEVCIRIEEIGGRPYGILSARSALERRFDTDEVAFLRSVASIVSAAIDLAQREGLFELSADMLAVVGADGYFVRVNPACERILGWTPEELCARPFLEFTHPEQRDAMLGLLGALHGGSAEVIDFESQVRSKTGEYRDLLLSARSSADGRFIYCAAKDITIRRRREAEAVQAAAENELILQSAGEGIFRVADDGRITYINETGAQLLGWDAEQLIGRNAHETFHHTRPDGSPYPLSECQAFCAMCRGEIAHIVGEVFWRADGTSFPVEYTSAPIRTDRDTTGAVAVFTDITDRRRVEAQALLTRAAEQANRAKSEFLSRMSHELRTPLNAILGFGQLLERSPIGERERGFCEQVNNGGRHLLTLIDEVLDISRIESGTLSTSVEPVHLACAIDDAIDLIGPIADQHHITIESNLGEHADTYVLADLQGLKQILLNLLSNAVKYNRPNGRVRITATSDGATVTVAVTDTGRGITAEVMPRLFTPFDRLGAEATKIEGTGLGLALSRRLTEAMGGTLDAVSEINVGSTFQLRLATSPPPQALSRSATPARRRSGTSPARTVLCIEDNVANLQLVETVLADDDIDVIAAAAGRLGLDIATSTHPDLILLDINLPDIPGHTILTALRDHPETAHIPVIVVTADATENQRQRMLELGASAYVTKPIDIDALSAAVSASLRATGGPQQRTPSSRGPT